MGDLIPGLPEEVARECLVRVRFDQFPTVRSISRLWRYEVESPFYHRLRRSGGQARTILAMVQADPPLADSGPAHKYSSSGSGGPSNSYRLVLFDPLTDTWVPLPRVPGGLPLFCQLAVAGHRLVVVSGWDPDTWAPTDAVHVFDFVTGAWRRGAWRRGASIPGPRRSFFACAAAASGVVFVAGGHDEEKNALRSALAYDINSDTWTPLPDMAEERDEPRGVYLHGRFQVIGGYPTQAQGHFTGSAESFDPATWTWGPVEDGVLADGTCPRTCCAAADDGGMYMLSGGHVAVHESAKWRNVAPVPEDARTASAVAALRDGRVVVVGSGCHGGDQAAYVLCDEAGKGVTWTRAQAPPEFRGHVQAACCVEM